MASHLASHFRAARQARGLTPGELSRRAGYRNTRKAAARVARFERGGSATGELPARLADALDIDLPTVEELLARDGRAGAGGRRGGGDISTGRE